MTIEELIDELQKLARIQGAEVLVWVELEKGIDTISSVSLRDNMVILIPTVQDSA